MMYWMQLTENEYKTIYDELAKIEADKLELENKTVDQIATGEQQPDSDHNMKGVNTYNGTYQDIYYRDARNGGWFSYDMNTQNVDTLILRATYWGAENGLRTFHIIVDGDTIAEENVSNKWNVSDFVDVDYEIPVNLTEGKSKINVKFDAMSGNTAGGIYHLRLYEDVGRGSKKYYEEASVTEINTGTVSSEKNFNYKTLNSSTGTHKNETWRDCNNGGYIKYTIPVNDSDSMKLRVRYWGNEGYEREFDIKVDGTVVATEKINGKWNTDAFQNVDYEIPVSLVKDKESVEVSFEPKSNNYAGGLFYLWMHGYKEVNESTALNSYKKDIFSVSIENGSKIGRASCRERVSLPV